jgi:hypothetical protein
VGGSRRVRWVAPLAVALLLTTVAPAAGLVATWSATGPVPSTGPSTPPAPKPEPVKVEELPLPPAPDASGACSATANPKGTGCVTDVIQSGGWLRDAKQVVVAVTYAGATDPANIYRGAQLIAVRTDGKKYADGDAFRCITCGTPPENQQGLSGGFSYPQPFRDGKRVLIGNNILDCSPLLVTDEKCTGAAVHVYPIRWNVTPDGSGKGGSIRELRIHPDDTHLGFNGFVLTPDRLDQFGYLGKLQFDAAPTTGTPLVPRYDLVNVTRLFDPAPEKQAITVDPNDPSKLKVQADVPTVGELRGFSQDGKEVFYIGNPTESSNIDVYAANLTTGTTRRLTRNPEYTDPVDSSPDDRWIVAMDTRGTGRQLFMAAMEGVPPLTDLLTVSAVSSVRNNGQRRFFQPWLIDRAADRGTYQGQRLNDGDGKPGSISDPNWNGMADPRWSPDGTSVVYWQALVVPPACGGANPLPCPASTEPGGRASRVMIARLTSRKPQPIAKALRPIADTVPWGKAYVTGEQLPTRWYPPAGTYTLAGKKTGKATMTIGWNDTNSRVQDVAVTYQGFSDDGVRTIDGTESVSASYPSTFVTDILWKSDLTSLVREKGRRPLKVTKTSSPDGFHLTISLLDNELDATGTLTTTVGGQAYTQPANGT